MKVSCFACFALIVTLFACQVYSWQQLDLFGVLADKWMFIVYVTYALIFGLNLHRKRFIRAGIMLGFLICIIIFEFQFFHFAEWQLGFNCRNAAKLIAKERSKIRSKAAELSNSGTDISFIESHYFVGLAPGKYKIHHLPDHFIITFPGYFGRFYSYDSRYNHWNVEQ